MCYSVKSELILSSKPCPNFRMGYVCNRDYSSKFGAAGKAGKIDLDGYISRLAIEGMADYLEDLKKLQDEGIKTLIKVVEIKSDEDHDEASPIKKGEL